MATPRSSTAPSTARTRLRRDAIVQQSLDHAQLIITRDGVGALTVSEVARRLGIRPPSLYKYFPSLHALYDALFLRGMTQLVDHLAVATADAAPGLDRILISSRAMIRWALDEPGLTMLLHSRPVPGFVPSEAAFAPSQAMWTQWRADLAYAVERGELAASADSDEALRLLTVLISGICSQQLANQPGASFDEGSFSGLTETALQMFVRQHAPDHPTETTTSPGKELA